MTKQRMTIEWISRVKALKQQGFDVHVMTDADGVIIHILKQHTIYMLASPSSNT